MALCTNPPRPFVGEEERSGELRPDEKGARSSDAVWSPLRSCLCADRGTGEPKPVVDTEETLEKRLLTLLVPYVELVRDGERDRSVPDSAFSGSAVDSRLKPGNFMRPLPLSDGESEALTSCALRRYASEPTPRSGVCRNHEGSFCSRAWEISARDGRDESSGGIVVEVRSDTRRRSLLESACAAR